MGTRHLICVVKDGEYKVAQYGQWDGYPGGQGIDILDFLTNEIDRETFEAKVKTLTWITDKEHKAQWVECGALKDSDLVSMAVAEKHAAKYPENSRDTGAKILSVIQNSDRPIRLISQLEFAGDSLFCEWAYVIDLDKNTFEVYEGFNKEPLQDNERFSMLEKHKESIELDGQKIIESKQNYYPVKFAKSFELDNLPPVSDFLAFFDKGDEDAEL